MDEEGDLYQSNKNCTGLLNCLGYSNEYSTTIASTSSVVLPTANDTLLEDDDNVYLYYPDFSQIPVVRGLFMFLFIVECFVGVFGNLLVCLTVYRNKSMHSPVNYYIVNLGVCDFLVGAFVLPMKLFELMADVEINMMNDFWCTTLRFLESVVVFASVFTLVAICIERYYAVVYPVHSRINMTDRRIRRVIFLVWLIPILCASPSLYPAHSEPHLLSSEYGKFSRKICHDEFPADVRRGYFLFLFIFIYLIPLVFITATCLAITRALMQKIPVDPGTDPRALSLERGRRKVAKMVLVVVFAFIFCWSPYFIITAITQVHNFFDKSQFIFTMLIINFLAFTHSCINPIVYFSMSARFRKGFVCILESLLLCWGRHRYSPENSSSIIRRTSHRLLNGRHTSYSDVFQCHNCRRHSGNVESGSCHHFRHHNDEAATAAASDSFGKSPNQARVDRLSRYRYNSQDSSEMYPRPVVLQFDSSRRPQCCSQLIPLQERKHHTRSNSHFLHIPHNMPA